MASETNERKATKSTHAGVPPPEPEHLPCPRCDSINTKFCYYNNYNFSQPRHFCKSCRRYWTHGGTLRDIPIGGGSRKNAKRSRAGVADAGSGAVTSFSSSRHDFRRFPTVNCQLLMPLTSPDHGAAVPFMEAKAGLNGLNACGSYTSLLNTQGTGLLSLGGFGIGIGPGFEDMGLGLGRAVWPFAGMVEGGPTDGAGGSGDTWRSENGRSGFVGSADCFSFPFPDLAIPTPAGLLK